MSLASPDPFKALLSAPNPFLFDALPNTFTGMPDPAEPFMFDIPPEMLAPLPPLPPFPPLTPLQPAQPAVQAQIIDPTEDWKRHALGTGFTKIRVQDYSDNGEIFWKVASFLRENKAVCKQVREIHFVGSPLAGSLLTMCTIINILGCHLPKLHTLTLCNIKLSEVGMYDGPVGLVQLHQVTLENLSNIKPVVMLSFLSLFSRIDHFLIKDAVLNMNNPGKMTMGNDEVVEWRFIDVHELLPQMLHVNNLEIRGSSTSRFFVGVLNVLNPTAVDMMRSLSVSCTQTPDIVALGALLQRASMSLTSVHIDLTKCTEFNTSDLPLLPEEVDGYLFGISNCFLMRHFSVNMHLSSENLQSNAYIWQTVASAIARIPAFPGRSIQDIQITLHCEDYEEGTVSSAALAALDWDLMAAAWGIHLDDSDDPPSITFMAMPGFENDQMDYIVGRLGMLARHRKFYMHGIDPAVDENGELVDEMRKYHEMDEDFESVEGDEEDDEDEDADADGETDPDFVPDGELLITSRLSEPPVASGSGTRWSKTPVPSGEGTQWSL
ncbi:hypothetical protein BDW22DRAFT_1428435 [Trametopsis cervina]|nr:hypothetical protein BDW22DRAFT_1428435 [Trametopsis cervina]